MRTITLRKRSGHAIFHGCMTGAVDFLNNLEPDKCNNLNLSQIDLRNLDWNGRNCDDIDFSNSNLCGANITESIFTGCDFSLSLLPYLCASYSEFSDCTFYDTEFGATDLSMSIFDECSFSGPGFFRLDFSSAQRIKNCHFKTENNEYISFNKSPLILHGHKYPMAFFESATLYNGHIAMHAKIVDENKTQPKIKMHLL